MTYTKAQMKATNKWMKENYDRINLTLPAGRKAVWKEAAEAHGMSVNEFVKYCVDKEINSV